MTKLPVVLLVLCGVSAVAAADSRLSGRVKDVNDQPVKNASVVITDAQGATTVKVTTDGTGYYAATVPAGGSYAVVFSFGKTRAGAHVDVPADGEATLDSLLAIGSEVIEVHDPRQPLQYAKPKSDPLRIPPYSDRAALSDAWTRAWLLLDVDARGVVTRVKFLKRPGYELDDIAVKHAFGLQFDPARDKSGVPTRSFVVWPLEWPSREWMILRTQLPLRLPSFADTVQLPNGFVVFDQLPPCAQGNVPNLGAMHPVVRDCSIPDLSVSDASEPWLVRDSRVPPPVVATAAVIDPQTVRAQQVEQAQHVRRAAIVATAATGVLAIGTVLAYLQYDKYADRVAEGRLHGKPAQLAADEQRQSNWQLGTGALTFATIAVGAAAVHFWSSAPEISIDATARGGAVSYAGRF